MLHTEDKPMWSLGWKCPELGNYFVIQADNGWYRVLNAVTNNVISQLPSGKTRIRTKGYNLTLDQEDLADFVKFAEMKIAETDHREELAKVKKIPQQSTLFLRNMTVVDFAVVDTVGKVVGGSLQANVEVTGPVTEDEQVVIDFGSCKKDLKNIIDDFLDGYDHKCWFVNGISGGTLEESFEADCGRVDILVTPAIYAEVPSHTFKIIDVPKELEGCNHFEPEGALRLINLVMSNELTKKMRMIYPGVSVSVECTHEPFENPNFAGFGFKYVHGLPNSSSLRCRRGLHGHGSFVEIDAPVSGELDRLLSDMQDDIGDVMFVDSRNIRHRDMETWMVIEYEDLSDDYYFIQVNLEHHRVHVLPIDTTIENLTIWLAERYEDRLKDVGAKAIYMSEGLAKGARVCIR